MPMTPQDFARIQRDYLILTEKKCAVLLAAEFEEIKREIGTYLLSEMIEQQPAEKFTGQTFLEIVLDKVSEKLDRLSSSAGSIVESAQRRVIGFAGDSLKRFLPEIKTSIFEPDKEAIQKLVGRTQTGESLQKLFASMKPDIAEKAKAELIEGFSAGESNQQIARRINDVSDIGYTRALTISRTETNEAYRAASRDYYQGADVQEYVWMAVLDVRTCLICWHLHGQRFKSSKKVFSHPNCRCTMIPVTKGMKPIKPGAELLAKLEPGYQKQILGPKRFELFKSGDYGLKDFVGSEKTKDYGQRHFVKTLSSFGG